MKYKCLKIKSSRQARTIFFEWNEVESRSMRIENLKLKIFLFTILYFIFAIRDANAQALSVSIDPPIIQIDAKAPAIIDSGLTIQNESDQSITYTIFLMPFNASGLKSGEVEFDKSLLPKYQSLFMAVQISEGDRVLSEVKLAPRQKKELNLRISLAKGEVPKDYYFSVLFISEESKNSQNQSFTGARPGIGTNVLLSVGPKGKTQGYIGEFSAPKFVTKGPVEFELNIVNESKHFVTIKGNILIKNIFGQTVGKADLLPVNILAESERISTPVWNEKFLLGIYTADLTVALSEDGPLLKKSLIFLAFPLELVFGILIALALVIGIVRRVRRKEVE